jgi:uncharacterized membrane protein YphA (DoxX/SURF4 family)
MITPPPSVWLALRILVGLPFMASGVFNAINWDASNAFNSVLLGDTLAPALTLLGIIQIVGGGLIIAGQVKWGALVLLAFLLPATLRHFLAARELISEDALTILAKRGQLSCVEKNVGLIGVMIFFVFSAPTLTKNGRSEPVK